MRKGKGDLESEVTVIGAGPSGCFISYLLAKEGMKVIVVEKKKKPWLPLKCAGLVSDRINEIIKLPRKLILNKCDEALLNFPKNKKVLVKGKERAFVIDRIKFDKFLFELAKSSGVTFLLGERFEDFEVKRNKLIVHTGKRKIASTVLVGADGAVSRVRKVLGLKIEVVEGFQARIRMKKHQPNRVELIFDKGISDFFSWIVSEGGEICRVGVMSSEKSKIALRKLFKLLEIPGGKVIDYQFGFIPRLFCKKMSGERVILVGDAAAQTKASTGGGIITGLIGSKVGAECILKAFEEQCFTSKFFRENYDKVYYKTLGKELKLSYFLSQVLRELNNEDLFLVSKVFSSQAFSGVIGEHGDMEIYSKWLFPLLREKHFLSLALLLILKHPSLILDILHIGH